MQKEMWGEVLTKLEKRINRPSFNTWLRPTCFLSQRESNVRIGVPNEVFVYWLGEHYVNVIVETLTDVLGFKPEISFVILDEASEDILRPLSGKEHGNIPTQAPVDRHAESQKTPLLNVTSQQVPPSTSWHQEAAVALEQAVWDTVAPLSASKCDREAGSVLTKTMWAQTSTRIPPKNGPTVHPQPETRVKADRKKAPLHHKMPVSFSTPSILASPHRDRGKTLNARYTFQSYVVGSNNRLAHAAALAVADQRAVNYNPLFIYGGVGLGKTHLLHAIGNHFVTLKPKAGVLYLSSEQFINELVTSIREDRMSGFREKYRNIDLLLVDDIQFIARKERTQEEFFHTFNTLYQARKQIVLTSDCPPKKIPTIAEQLRSRFEWGLIADIQPPDLETRIAILKKKAELQGMFLPDEVAIYIASKVKSNIRELEGSLSKIRAYSSFNGQEITLALAQRGLRDLFDETPKKVTVDLVQQVVANHYHIELASMRSSARNRKCTLPRQIAMYLVRELTNLSLPDIGRNFGGRDHTTVMHACKKVERTQEKDQGLQQRIMQIRELIKA